MKFIPPHETNERLASIGMRLGEWGNIEPLSPASDKAGWKHAPAPPNNLFNFSHHVASWLPSGEWKLVQLDNSSGWIDPAQVSLLASLMSIASNPQILNSSSRNAVLIEFHGESCVQSELTVGNIIFALLLFKLHAHIVSSGGNAGVLLSIQDGFVYFSGTDSDTRRSESIVANFLANPCSYPVWIRDLAAAGQEAAILK